MYGPAPFGAKAAAQASRQRGAVRASGEEKVGDIYEPVTPSARDDELLGGSL